MSKKCLTFFLLLSANPLGRAETRQSVELIARVPYRYEVRFQELPNVVDRGQVYDVFQFLPIRNNPQASFRLIVEDHPIFSRGPASLQAPRGKSGAGYYKKFLVSRFHRNQKLKFPQKDRRKKDLTARRKKYYSVTLETP